ncbi:MAG: glycosyltransferase family 4 protein [Candidatus Acidiferrum sp.]
MIPLIVDLETQWRGGQNQALLLLKGLYERGHPAELVATHGSALGHRAKKAGIFVHGVSRGMFRLPAAREVRSLLADGRIELVHANEAHAVTAAWLAMVNRNLPLVVSRRVGYPLSRGWLAQSRYRRADCILANSQWVANQAIASGANREKIRVVYEGTEIPVPLTADQRSKARQRWKIAEGIPLLGCVGVLLSDKGQEWLIRALVEVRRDFPEARLILAGDGPCRHDLEKLAESLGVSAAVIFAGFVKDVESVYAALDVFLLPSFFEAFNNSLLAAMAYEIPSIAFSRGALPEIIEDGKNGLLVSGPDVTEIAAAVKRVLCDSQFAGSLGQAGRASVATNFTADHMVEGTLKVYAELLESPH